MRLEPRPDAVFVARIFGEGHERFSQASAEPPILAFGVEVDDGRILGISEFQMEG